ncbi:hypothetical protein B0A55_09340 [Friedmanniomyces simplex]|uniref:Ubiquinone biosynthesis O-methyltransferase, mitochondrial n=1 Tax=Friedmanniomyces simplex TaxID=329884 RepID=A0A4U0WY67_9PEZI|nr:hypothetical protein B0A55_09340 [Friedmanniomyces simplex]
MAIPLLRLPADIRRAVFNHVSATSSPLRTTSGYAAASARTYTTTTTPPQPESSVNHTEVSHFSALASSWWDPHGSSRLLHLMNPLRHDFLSRCLSASPPSPDTKLHFLDVGCGGGIFAESAARLAIAGSVTAIDPTPEVIAVAKKHQRSDPLLLQPGKLTYLQTPIEDLHTHTTLHDGNMKQYDMITLFEVLEHIQRPYPFLSSILPHLKPGGWLIGSTIARHPVSWFTTKFMAEDVLGIVPRGTHEWGQYLLPGEVRQWARGRGELSTSEGFGWRVMGIVYVPGVGWREVGGSERYGNYFFGTLWLPSAVFNYRYLQARFSIREPYTVLGIQPGCTTNEAQRAYIKLALVVHPDKATDPNNKEELRQRNELAGLLNAAYDVLKAYLVDGVPLPKYAVPKDPVPKHPVPKHPVPKNSVPKTPSPKDPVPPKPAPRTSKAKARKSAGTKKAARAHSEEEVPSFQHMRYAHYYSDAYLDRNCSYLF